MNQTQIQDYIKKQKDFYNSGKTLSLEFRKKHLKLLLNLILKHESDLLAAINKDLHRPLFECYTAEVGFIMQEIRHCIKKLRHWTSIKKVPTPLGLFPGKSYIYPEPYGLSLIIGPWNYPFVLLIAPLIGSMAAGNCTVLKPSEFAVATGNVIKKLINENFDPAYLLIIEGEIKETQVLLNQNFDYIFFTGSTVVGKIIMEKAAKTLTPVTLELGGKCPAIVDKDTEIDQTARKIVWGKFYNAGQTCIAIDHVLVEKSIKMKLIEKIKHHIKIFYSEDIITSPDYSRIINQKQFDRLSAYLKQGNIIYGGQTDKNNLFISPTLIDQVTEKDSVMQDEIFGPLLPVLEYTNLDDLINQYKTRDKPLALYIFSNNRKNQEFILKNLSSGGVTINDTLLHTFTRELPFGGVGNSGMGKYHGKSSFDTFTNFKSVFKQTTLIDPPIKYPPYGNRLNLIKKIFRLFY